MAKRSTIIVMTSLLVLALSLPAMAEGFVRLDLSGEVGADFLYLPGEGLSATGTVRAAVGLTRFGTDGGMKVFLDLAGAESKREGQPFGTPAFSANEEALRLQVVSARVESYGSFWPQGPMIRTTAGRFGRNYSDWVIADGFYGDGISVEEMSAGDWVLNVTHLWLDPANRATALSIAGKLGGTETGLAWVNHSGGNDWALRMATSLYGLNVNGTYARDDLNDAMAFRVNLDANLPEASVGIVLNGLDGDFWPRFRKMNDEGKLSVNPDRRRGYTVTTKTAVSELNVTGAYGWSEYYDGTDERTDVSVSLNKRVGPWDITYTVSRRAPVDGSWINITNELGARWGDLDLGYKLELPSNQPETHTFSASTKLLLPWLSHHRVDLAGKVALVGNVTRYEADAQWTVPNGWYAGVHYANYNRDGGPSKGEEADGLYLASGFKVTF